MKKKFSKKWIIAGIVILLVLIFAPGSTEEPEQAAAETETIAHDLPEVKKESTEEEQEKALFQMYSNDTIGATKHTVVGGDYEPTGTYRIVCTSGHGCLNINDNDLYVFAADEYIGEEYSGLIYEEEAEIELNANDILMIRAYNSSDFNIEFYISE